MDENNYAGFWIRSAAALIDSILILLVIVPVMFSVYGNDFWLQSTVPQDWTSIAFNYVLPAVVIIVFWIYKSATPGKMLTKLTIIDAKSGEKPSTGQFIVRYVGYYVALLPLMLGLFWIGFDSRKQGWHDKLAGTVVVRNTPPRKDHQARP